MKESFVQSNKNPLAILFTSITILVVALLVFTFMPMPEDEYTYDLPEINSRGHYYITKEQFKNIRVRITLEEVGVDVKNYFYPPLTELEFHPSTTEVSKKLNTRAYQIAQRYFNEETMPNINPEFIDPILPMALSNVEWPGITDNTVLWSAALPIRYLDEANWTETYMDNMSITVFNQTPEMWNSVFQNKTLGPLQMTIFYGTDTPAIDELVGTEKGRLLDSFNGSTPPTWITNNLDLVDTMGYGIPTGDRFNWRDACNRTAGYFNHIMGVYNSRASISKTGDYEIQNKYSFMALMALSHNNGLAVVISSDDYVVSESHWVFGEAKNARKLANQLGRQEVLEDLQDRAKKAVDDYRNGSALVSYIGHGEGYSIYQDWVEKGYVTDDMFDATKSGITIRVGYPVQTLYNYFVLRELYGGR